jgi:hypothetical protein
LKKEQRRMKQTEWEYKSTTRSEKTRQDQLPSHRTFHIA